MHHVAERVRACLRRLRMVRVAVRVVSAAFIMGIGVAHIVATHAADDPVEQGSVCSWGDDVKSKHVAISLGRR